MMIDAIKRLEYTLQYGEHADYYNGKVRMPDDIRTVIEAAKQYQVLAEEEYVSIYFDSGTTFALTGENAGHWVEGSPTHEPIGGQS